jgi:2-oxoglutarate ferredoxin oxidoreductase subunit beta
MLTAGASFVARVYAEKEQVEYVFKEAMKHKGFAFIEILQPCIIFHPDIGYKGKTYSLEKEGHDKTNFESAMKKADEFDYNGIKEGTKIPLGIFYQKEKDTIEELYPQLADLKKKKMSWKDIKR